MSMGAYLLPAYRDELEKRRGDACALQSFAKHENALGQFRIAVLLECDESSHRFVFALGT
jgi:hypothetical protein